jgi:dnd system-associated protein 4
MTDSHTGAKTHTNTDKSKTKRVSRRIYPPKDLEEKVVEPLKAFFGTKYEVMVFAAALGYRARMRVPMTKKGEGIRIEYFRRKKFDLVISLLAVDETGDLLVVGDDRAHERDRIFEEYAAGGLKLIFDACFTTKVETTLEGLRLLLNKYPAVISDSGSLGTGQEILDETMGW